LLEKNVALLLSRLSPSDVVIDVGGWACPFNRAQWVLDAQQYESRGFYRTFGGPPSQGGDQEWFSRESWVIRDKQFDFAICSHTLEDLRDPLWVCSELSRIAGAGYIEVPSRQFESTLEVERPNQAGLSHHRWLIDVVGQHLRFMHKFHMIHADRSFSLPAKYKRRLTAESSVSWIWWEGAISCEEVEIHGIAAQEAELREYSRREFPRSRWLYKTDAVRRRLESVWRRAKR
jgi:hypothetical protein